MLIQDEKPFKNRVFKGNKLEIIEGLRPYAPLYLLVSEHEEDCVAFADALHTEEGQSKALPCPVQIKQGPRGVAGVLQVDGFLQSFECCSVCKHQLACAVDGQTRSFITFLEKSTKKVSPGCDN